jgi:hypothetical protein
MNGRHYPVVYKWCMVDVLDGAGEVHATWAMVPTPRYEGLAYKQYAAGEEYALTLLEARSRASHNHFWASLQNGFDNLPDNIAARFPSVEHMRAFLLIECGWCDEVEFDLASESEAKKLAARTRTESPYARIHRHNRTLIVRYPKSQSAKAMGKADFEASKKATLDLLEGMIGVPLGSLSQEAGRAA